MNTKYWIAVITLTFTIMITGCSSDGDTKYVQEPIHELWKSGGLHVYQDPLGGLVVSREQSWHIPHYSQEGFDTRSNNYTETRLWI